MAIPERQQNYLRTSVFTLALLFLLFPAGGLITRAQPAAAAKRVLVLYWDNKDFPGNIKFDESFKTELGFVAPGAEYYPEYMETTRFPGANQVFFHDYLRQKYAGRKIDVVVATADIPLKFLIQYRADLFTDAPIVFVANAPPPAEQIVSGAGMTGIVHQSTYRETMELALKLHPDADQLFVISGSPEHDKRFESVARTELAPFEKQIKITYLTDLELPDLIARTSSLPAHSFALYVWQQATDEQGKLLETYEVLARISPKASVPIYGMGSPNLGQGIVGGYLQGPDNNGAKTAELDGRILNGKRAQDIPVGTAPTVPEFDWRQLRRWGINESSLPAGSVIQFRQLTFWQEDKWAIIGFSTAILVEAGLIGFLLIALSRVRSSERERARLAEVAETTHRRLDETVSNVPGIVWETLIDPVTGQRKTTFISDHVYKLLGYTPEEWLSRPPGFGVTIVHEDDRERVVRESEEVMASGHDGVSQFRWLAKDGRIIWTENYLSPILDANGKTIGLRGVAIDISDRKQAEEAVKSTTEKDRAILEAVPDLMFLHTRDGVYLDYHCKDIHELSAPPEKFLGKNVREVLPSHLVQKLMTGFERAGKNGGPHMFEYELAVNGRHRWYEARMVPSGENVLTLVRDVTERKTAEEALRQSETTIAAELADTQQLQRISSKLLQENKADELYGQILDAAVALMKSDAGSMQIVTAQNELHLLAYKGFDPESTKFWEYVGAASHSSCAEALRTRKRVVVPDVEACDFMAGTEDLDGYRRSNVCAVQSTPLISRNGRVVGMISTHWLEPHQPSDHQLRLLDVLARQAADLLERKQAIDALRESEERFRLAEQAAHVGTWEWDVRTGESVWSDMLWELLGRQPDQVPITVERFVSIIHPDDRERVWDKVSDILANGKGDYYDEFRIVHPDGQVFWLSSKGRVFRAADGAPERMIGVNTDINTRKLAEEAARLAQQKDAAILGAIPDLMFLQTRDGVYLDFHCSDPDDLLVPPEAFIGKNMRDVLPPELAAEFLRAFQRAIDTGELQLFEYELPLNGEQRWFEGRIIGSGENILSVVRDITERWRAVEALQRSHEELAATNEELRITSDELEHNQEELEAVNERLAGIIGLAMDAIITVDQNQSIVLFNTAAERIFGRPADEAIGLPLNVLIPARYAEVHRDHLNNFGAQKVIRRIMGERGAQLYGVRRSGEEFPMEASISQLELKGQKFFTVILRDITDRRLAEAALKESEFNYRSVFNAANDAIFIHDLETGAIVDANERTCEMYGYAIEDVTGLTVGDLSSNQPPYTQAGAMALMQKAGAGEPQVFEWWARKQSGELFWVEVSLRHTLFRGKDSLLAIVRDVTERKLAEAALKESEVNYRTIFNTANDAIFVIDFNSKTILDVNERMCEMYGCTPEQARTFWVQELSPNQAPYSEKEAAAFIDAAAAGIPQVFEWRSRKLNGEDFWVEVNLRHISLRSKECLLAVVRDITERKLAEDTLAASHRQMTDILESIGDAFYSLDNDLRFTYVNRKTEELWRMKREDLLGRNFLDVFPQSVGTPSYYECMRAVEERQAVSFEAVSPILNRWVDVSVYPTPSGLSVYFRDITERKQALDELRESEERFGKSFRANPQPMSITTLAEGIYIDVNESFIAMSAYAREELIGHTSLELNIWGDQQQRDDFMKQLVDDGSLANRETQFRTRDGSHRVLLSSAERIELGGRDCVLMASSDITERMLVQQALRESEERFRNMADTAPVMIWIAGTDKNSTYFNQQWLDFTGRPVEQEMGVGWMNGIHPSDFDGCSQMFAAAFDSREPFRMEYRLRRADGAYRWVFDSGTPRFSASGKFLGYIGSCVDITDRKESEAALVFAHEALENAYAEVNRLKTQLQEENIYLQEEIKLQQNFGEIIGGSDALKYVLFKIEQVAPTDSTVLITGETGTGKELVARAIHTASTRRDRPMVKVNCAALSASLIESELFGHEKGAFTGALSRKIGRFELAEKGTIFLDEIGELPLELQVKLLRVIQEGEFERLGSSRTVKVDVRIIAATNRNLRDQVNKGLFREDLWYRLNVFPITVPPLRARRDDIPMLIEHFAETFARKLGKEIKSIAPATINALRNYSWPGNVRELANVIERAVINAHGPILRVHEQLRAVNGETAQSINRTLEEVERDYITRVLEDRGWRIEGPHGAAYVLGMNPSTLRTRMAKLGISKGNQAASGNGNN